MVARILLTVIISLLSFNLFADDYFGGHDFDINDPQARKEYIESIPITKWPDNVPGGPVFYEEWKATQPEIKPFEMQIVKEVSSPNKAEVPFIIIINSDLYPQVSTAIDTYVADLTSEGYSVKINSVSGGTPEDIKLYLQGEYAIGLTGCVLIGDLPVPWFEETCWDEYDNFPIDLFYMDMDGTWEDYDSDGIYDLHYGDMGPEIWVGRLTASTLNLGNFSEAELINRYFAKNHDYRLGNNYLNNRALVYIDDDWSSNTGWNGNVGLAYPTRTFVNDDMTTTAPDYETRWLENYESVLVCVHSWPQGHSFKIGENWSSTHNYDITGQKPVAHFYNLFACSNSRYTAADYCGGWYVFAEDYGLASVGSSKTGSMLYFEYYYSSLGQGNTIGQAFQDWFEAVSLFGFPNNDLCWFYGMTLIGDPTLKSLSPPPVTIEIDKFKNATPNNEYCDTVLATGGGGEYTYHILADTLPTGLALDTLTGIITGMPTDMGACTLSVKVDDQFTPPNSSIKELSLKVTYLCGDGDHNNGANILDIIYLINYLYNGGPMPDPYYIGDVDGSGVVNILDITYFIGFLYSSGPELLCP